jgi:hypothetical protein
MAGPNMTKERYDSLTKGQKIAYWVIVAVGAAFIGYMLLFYRR